jgi:hypothetical protein
MNAYAQAVEELSRARRRGSTVHPSVEASTLPAWSTTSSSERFVLLPSEDPFMVPSETVGTWFFGTGPSNALSSALRRKSTGTVIMIVWVSGALLTPTLLVLSSPVLLGIVLTTVVTTHVFFMLLANRALLWRLMAEFDCWYAVVNSLLGAVALELMLLSNTDGSNFGRIFVPPLLLWFDLLYIIWDTFPVGFRTKLSKFMYVGLLTEIVCGLLVAFHSGLRDARDSRASMLGSEALMIYCMSLLYTVFQVSITSTRLYFLSGRSTGRGAAASANGRGEVAFYFIRSSMRLTPLTRQAQIVLEHRRPNDPVARQAVLRARAAVPGLGNLPSAPAPEFAPYWPQLIENELAEPPAEALVNLAYANALPERFRYEEALWPSAASLSVRHQLTLWLVWAVAALLNFASLVWGRALGLWSQIPLLLLMWPAPFALIATVNKRLLKLLLLEFEGVFILFQVLVVAALLIRAMPSSFDAVSVIIVLPTVIAGVLCDTADPRVRRQAGLLITSCSLLSAVSLLVGIVAGVWRTSSKPIVVLGSSVDPTAALNASLATAIIFFMKTIYGLLSNKEDLVIVKSKIVATKVPASMAEQLYLATVDAVRDAIAKLDHEARAAAVIVPSLGLPKAEGQLYAAEPEQG